jgi:hypothetical protein
MGDFPAMVIMFDSQRIPEGSRGYINRLTAKVGKTIINHAAPISPFL